MQAGSPHLDIFEPRPVLSGGLEAVLGQEAESLGSMSGNTPPRNAYKGAPLDHGLPSVDHPKGGL